MLILELIGGVGLFLLGVALLGDSIRALAGGRMREWLQRLAGTPVQAAATGTAVTAVAQSATATVILTMGLTSAGLIALPEALGIMVGAHVGTTTTAWLVAVLGLRFSIARAALVLVAAGALLRLFGRGSWSHVGLAMASFGVLFVGIGLLRDGMASYTGDLAGISGTGWGGGLLLVLIGVVSTVLVQSSSVSIATTLAALDAGAVGFREAALLVVGQNLGIALTVIGGALGTGAAGRRIGAANLAFAVGTSLIVLLALRPLLWTSQAVAGPGVLGLALFHTLFNGIGAAVWLPVARPMASWLERRIPEQGLPVDRFLDPVALTVPDSALAAARRALGEALAETTGVLRSRLQHGELRRTTQARLDTAEAGFGRVEAWLGRIRPQSEAPGALHVHLVHALANVENLLDLCRSPELRRTGLETRTMRVVQVRLMAGLAATGTWLEGGMEGAHAADADLAAVASLRDPERSEALIRAALGDEDLMRALAGLDALDWARQVADRLSRALRHLCA